MDDVVVQGSVAIPVAEAAVAAGATEAQLRGWARRGMVKVVDGTLPPDEVVRAAALRHFSATGPTRSSLRRTALALAALVLPQEPHLIVLDARGAADVIERARLAAYVTRPGAYAVFDPTETRRRLANLAAGG